MEKRTQVAKSVGVFTLSALALAVSGSAQAALTATIIDAASAGAPMVRYNNAAGGNNSAANTALMGGAAGPFAPTSSVNITYSRHNLGATNQIDSNHTAAVLATNTAGTINNVVGTNQICVFCHTPHGFNTNATAPLWNKQVNAAATYTVYNAGNGNKSDTLDAALANGAIGSVSLACLSCHDGTQAMDNMINAPGSGGMAVGFDASSAAASTNAGVSQGYSWGTATVAPGNGFALMSQGGAGQITGGGTNGDAPAKEGIDLGTDLSNDHPISVAYCGGGINTAGQVAGPAIAAGTCNDRLFNLPTTATVNGQSRFWVDTRITVDADAQAAGAASILGATAPITRDPTTAEVYTGGTYAGDAAGRGFTATITAAEGFGVRTKQDIMLFTNNANAQAGTPTVECASCHDPHTPNNGTFLRVSNAGSGLCLSCHVK